MVAGIAATAAVFAGLSAGTTEESDQSSGTPNAQADLRGHAPFGPGIDFVQVVEKLGERCPGAVEAASPSELQTQVKAQVSAPRVGKLAGAWSCGEDGVLMYSNGVQVSFAPGWSKVDASTKWELRIKEDGGRVETINGLLTYIAAAEGAATRHVVAIVNGDTMILLLSEKDVSIDVLVEMAQSMDLSHTPR